MIFEDFVVGLSHFDYSSNSIINNIFLIHNHHLYIIQPNECKPKAKSFIMKSGVKEEHSRKMDCTCVEFSL